MLSHIVLKAYERAAQHLTSMLMQELHRRKTASWHRAAGHSNGQGPSCASTKWPLTWSKASSSHAV